MHMNFKLDISSQFHNVYHNMYIDHTLSNYLKKDVSIFNNEYFITIQTSQETKSSMSLYRAGTSLIFSFHFFQYIVMYFFMFLIFI